MPPLILEQHLVPISVLYKHPRNYKKHPEAQLVKVRASLKKFGQTKPILVRRDTLGFFIIAGHCVTQAAEDLQWIDIWLAVAPEHWTNEDALAYLVADNETSNGAEINELMLAELLEESRNAGYDLAALGSSEADLSALLEKLANEHLAIATLPGASDHDIVIDDEESPLDAPQTTCPNCGHIF